MEFKQAMRVIKRMCAAQDGCEKCVLELNCPFITVPSDHDYDKAEATLTKWSAEHPEKTIADDFFEKFPKAPRTPAGDPEACARRCGYIKECPFKRINCAECWRRPLEEVEG